MAWLRLRDKVLINTDMLTSVEARSSSGMSHTAKNTREQLESLVNFCFTTSDGKEFTRFFIPAARATPIMEDLQGYLCSSRDIVILDDILAAYGIRPEDTY